MNKKNIIQDIRDLFQTNRYLPSIDLDNLEKFDEDYLNAIFDFYETVVIRFNDYPIEDQITFLESLKKQSANSEFIFKSAIIQKKLISIKDKENEEKTDADYILQNI